MNEIRKQFLDDLLARPTNLVASQWLFDRVPIIFSDDLKEFISWKHELSELLNVDPSCVLILGSSAFGISLNPHKNFRAFGPNSDIDVAIVSEYYFTIAWRSLRSLGSKRHSLSQAAKQSLNDHITRLIYWGTIATDQILQYLPFGKVWDKAFLHMSKIQPTEGRLIKARVYKDFESLRAYHVNNLKNLRTQELERGIEDD